MSMTPPQPRGTMPPIPAQTNRRRLLLLVLGVVLVILLIRACAPHENKYEKIVNDLNVALQNNDLAGVQKLQNAETATTINRGIVGRLADRLAPLGKIKLVKEDTPSGMADRRHEFEVTFEKGVLYEDVKFDPQDKIVHFNPSLEKPKK